MSEIKISVNNNMNEKIIVSKSVLTDDVYYEKVDSKIIYALLDSDLLKENFTRGTVTYNEPEILRKLLKQVKNGIVKNKYKHAKNGIPYFGRVSSQSSLGNLRREIRGTLTAGSYIDIDIVNAHPNMICQLLECFGLSNTSYDNYCNNREKTLKKISTHHKVKRDAAKQLFHQVGYGGSYDKWVSKNNATGDKLKFVSDFKKEAVSLANKFIASNPKLYKKYVKKSTKDYNLDLGFLANCLQNHERIILENMKSFFTNSKYKIKNCILCHDGIMLMIDSITQSVLKKLSEFVYAATGFNLEYIEKPLKHYLNEITLTEEKIDPSKLNEIDLDYMDELKTYDIKKEYFEHFVCKCINPQPCYILLETNTDEVGTRFIHRTMDEKQIKTAFKHLSANTSDMDDSNLKFIKIWLEDPKIKVYMRMNFMPYNDVRVPNKNIKTYNLFSGYHSNIKSHSFDNKKCQQILKPFLDIVKGLCEDNQTYLNYFLKMIAFKLQYPRKKLPYAFVITGKQGTGKGLLMKGLSKIFGNQHVISSSKPTDFCGEHAEGVVNKLIVNMNECEGKATWDFQGFIKSLISEDKITVNPKYLRPYEVDNHALFIFTSNKDDVINIDSRSTDRRFIAFKASDKYINKHKYTSKGFWCKVVKLIDTPQFSSALYSYLNNMNVDDYDFSTNRLKCLTQTYWDMVRKSIPAAAQFMDFVINKDKYISNCIIDDDDEICNKEINDTYFIKTVMPRYALYKKFKSWTDKNRPNSSKQNGFKQSNNAFYSTIKELELPCDFKRINGNDMISYTPNDVHKHLLKRGWVEREDGESLENNDIIESDGTEFDHMFLF